MAEDLKKMYRKVMEDHFPDTLRMSFGDQDARLQEALMEVSGRKEG